ncbi:MAG: Na/Pi cotransporter family protein [Thermoanaerobaculia bacterium]|nr:Na/Pi cotransporter family protein [Thermoanaerobaculia bacterium]
MSIEAWQIGFSVLAGLVLFLYGIEHFSTEIQTVAGGTFRELLGRLTRNPVLGAMVGAVTTMIVQSSSATTVIAVSLVDAGTISFRGSLGIILGANVGTTVTAQLVALKLTAFAPIFLVAGFAVSLFGRRYRFLGRPLFYFGLVFFALALVSSALEPIKEDPRAAELLARYTSLPTGLLAGFLLTVVVQSSSVTTGLVVLLASAGLLDLGDAIPILLGANVGTTSTSLLATARMGLHARRAAGAHLIFNVGGVLLFLPLLGWLERVVVDFGGDAAQQVANAHLVFNVVTAVLFLVLVRPFGSLVTRIVAGEEEEILFVTEHLPARLPADNGEAFSLVEAELAHLFDVTRRLFGRVLELLHKPTEAAGRLIEKLEALNDYLDERIEGALLDLSQRSLTPAAAERAVQLVRLSNAMEQLGDTGAAIGRLVAAARATGTELPVQALEDVRDAGAMLERSFGTLLESFPELTAERAAEHRANQSELRRLINEKYALHVSRLAAGGSDAPAFVVEALSGVETASAQLREIRKQLENPVEVTL